MALKPEVSPEAAQVFLRQHYAPDAADLTSLEGGHFSRTFAFYANNQSWVVRFATTDDGFIKDAHAGQQFAAALPVPRVMQVIQVGEVFMAVSERSPGCTLSRLPSETLRDLLPVRLDLLDSLAHVDVQKSRGFGFWALYRTSRLQTALGA